MCVRITTDTSSLFVGGMGVTQAQKEKDPTESGSVVIQSPGLGESAVWILFAASVRLFCS